MLSLDITDARMPTCHYTPPALMTEWSESRMVTRILSREEQDEIDRRRKSCAQHTAVLVTPEAQATFLNKSSGIGREILPDYEATALHVVPRSPSNSDQSTMMSMGALLAKFDSSSPERADGWRPPSENRLVRCTYLECGSASSYHELCARKEVP
ncbi:hypothetical protein C8R47DRAFT_1063495 [Mycena vitilis]|nr:hypothetical protein C8R47DRAFT_1063495 [Mycena vitilis]